MKLKLLDKTLLPTSTRDFLFKKVVVSAQEIRNSLAPSVVLWSGETEDGYFRAALAGGAVMVHWAEREYQIKYGLTKGSYVGGTDQTITIVENATDELSILKMMNDLPTINKISEDSKHIKFEDVMDLMDWKFENKNIMVESILT